MTARFPPPPGAPANGSVVDASVAAGANLHRFTAPLTVTDADVAAANKDGAAAVASLRTLGSGAGQAMAGNDVRVTSEWLNPLDPRYGADPTGATDSWAAFHAMANDMAAAAGGRAKCKIPPGLFLLSPAASSNPPFMVPAGMASYVIEGASEYATTFAMSGNCSCLVAGNKQADHNVFSGIDLSRFGVDATGLPASPNGRSGGIVVGNQYGGVLTYTRIGWSNFRARNLRGFGAPADNLGPTVAGHPHHRWFMLNCHHPSGTSEATQDQLTHIHFVDCRFTGANIGFAVYGSSAGVTGLTATPGAGAGLAPGTWWWQVFARDANGGISLSAEASVVATSANGQAQLNWTGTATASSFDIYRTSAAGQSAGTESVLVASGVAGTSWTDTGVAGTPVAQLPQAVLPRGGLGVNIFYDDVRFTRCSHDLGTAFPGTGSLLNFQVGSHAYGGKVTLEQCVGVHGADVGTELDSFEEALMLGCRMDECSGGAFYFAALNWPGPGGVQPSAAVTTMDQQRVVVDDCSQSSSAQPNPGYAIQFAAGNLKLGRAVFRGFKHYGRRGVLVGAPLGEVLKVQQPIGTLELDLTSLIEGVGNTAAGPAWLCYLQAPIDDLVVRNLDMNVQGSTGAGTLPSLVYFYMWWPPTRFHFERVRLNGQLAGLGAAQAEGLYFGGQGAGGSGLVRRLVVESSPGTNLIAAYFDPAMAIPAGRKVRFADCDFSGLQGTELVFSGAAQALKAQVSVRDTNWKTVPAPHGYTNGGVSGTPRSPGSPTATAGGAGTGSLADGTYLARLFAKDVNGGLGAETGELSATVATGAGTGSIAYGWTAAANSPGGYRLYVTDPGGASGSEGHFVDIAAGATSFTLASLAATTAGAMPASTALTNVYQNVDGWPNEVGVYCAAAGVGKLELSPTGAWAGEQQTLYSSAASIGPFLFRLDPGWFARATFSNFPTWAISPVAST